MTVTNTPGVNSVSVAEHAMYMLLASARLSRKHDRFVRENTWGQRLSDLPAVRSRAREARRLLAAGEL